MENEVMDPKMEQVKADVAEAGAEGKEWAEGIDKSTLAILAGCVSNINKTVVTLRKAQAVAQIKIGKEMTKAQDLFPTKTGFSQWRIEHWPEISHRQATRFMLIFKEFGDSKKLVEAMPPSSLVVLLTATEEVRLEVERMVDLGETPKREAIIKMKDKGVVAEPPEVVPDVEVEPNTELMDRYEKAKGVNEREVERAKKDIAESEAAFLDSDAVIEHEPKKDQFPIEHEAVNDIPSVRQILRTESDQYELLRAFLQIPDPKERDIDYDLRAIVNLDCVMRRGKALQIAIECKMNLDAISTAFYLFGCFPPEQGYMPNKKLFKYAAVGCIDECDVGDETGELDPVMVKKVIMQSLKTIIEFIDNAK